MGFFSFGKRYKPREFGFVPRYYDKDKEDLEARLARHTDKDNIDLVKARIRSGFEYNSGKDRHQFGRANRQSNIRLVIIIAILGAITLAILRSDSLLKLIQAFSGGGGIE